MEKVFEEYRKYKVPFSATIELLSSCNWKCVHCYLENHADKGLEYTNVIEILKKLKRFGIYEVIFTGGEIFLRKDIIDIISEARRLGFNITLFSNLSLLDDFFIREIKRLGVSHLSGSIYSIDETVNDRITGVQGSLAALMANIEKLNNLGIRTELKLMVMKENYKDYAKTITYLKNNNIQFKTDANVFDSLKTGRGILSHRLNFEELCDVLPDIDKNNGVDYVEKSADDYVCSSMQTSFWIDHKGNLCPCNSMRVSMGNVVEEELESIWEKECYKKLRYAKWKDCNQCRDCPQKKYCVRCSGMANINSGNPYEKDLLACNFALVREAVNNI